MPRSMPSGHTSYDCANLQLPAIFRIEADFSSHSPVSSRGRSDTPSASDRLRYKRGRGSLSKMGSHEKNNVSCFAHRVCRFCRGIRFGRQCTSRFGVLLQIWLENSQWRTLQPARVDCRPSLAAIRHQGQGDECADRAVGGGSHQRSRPVRAWPSHRPGLRRCPGNRPSCFRCRQSIARSHSISEFAGPGAWRQPPDHTDFPSTRRAC